MKQKNLRGSVLVFTLLIMAVLLSATLSAATIVIVGKNSSRSTEKSAVSFQIAEGASENILKRIYKDSDNSLDDLANNLFGAASCSGGIISGTLPSSTGTYEVTFLENDGVTKLGCDGPGYSTYAEWRPKVVRIISSGTYAGTTRAIDIGVRP